MAHPRRDIESRATGKPTIDDNPHAIDCQTGFGYAGGQYDLASSRLVGSKCGPLLNRVKLAMQPMNSNVRSGNQIRCPVNFTDAGQKRQNVATVILGQSPADRDRHRIVNPVLDPAADVMDCQRKTPPLAHDLRRVAHQPGKPRTIQRRRHRQKAQVRTQGSLCIEGQRQTEITVKIALMHFVEEYCRNTR